MRSLALLAVLTLCLGARAQEPAECVDPFIGTTNFGTANPGAVTPHGMMSVVPFNVMGSEENVYDKDARWWSTPYEYHNKFFTGFAHGALSGVGCPELGALLTMATTGPLTVDYREYGTSYRDEKASPGYYSVFLDKYGVLAEATATAIQMINEANPNAAYLTLQGYEALKSVANGKSTKLIVPSEIQNVSGLLASMKEVVSSDKGETDKNS